MSTMSPTLSATITEVLPPRGYAAIDSGNRGRVRKWLTGRGMTYAEIANLTVAQLSAAYNDTTDGEFLALAAGEPVARPAQRMQSPPRPPEPVAATSAPVVLAIDSMNA